MEKMEGTMKRLIAAALVLLGLGAPTVASAQAQTLGEIFMAGENFCPRNTARTEGQLLPISQYQALFSLLGTTFGGDGRVTFALPDLRGRTPVGAGQGPGLSNTWLGRRFGDEFWTLTTNQMPAHTHQAASIVRAFDGTASAPAPAGNLLATSQASVYAPGTSAVLDMHPSMVNTALGNTGGNQRFELRDPFLAVTFCMVVFGIFPSRS